MAAFGDLGNPPVPLIAPTEFIDRADYVVMESTYGDRLHKKGVDHIPELVRIAPVRPEPLPFHSQIYVGDVSAPREFLSAPVEESTHDRTRPNLKIKDGCNNRCSFCIIPSVRGRSRSAPGDRVVEQVRSLAGRYCEVVLSGINLGRWGRDLPDRPRFASLLRRLLAETPVQRLRLSSIEPMDWTDDLLHLVASEPRIARHIHAPLQSGSDRILRRMYRRYRARHYAERLRAAHQLLPDAAFGADVLVGFPGETDADFEETRSLVAGLPFTYLHVFTYSARPSTVAAELPGQISPEVKRERNRFLRELAARKGHRFRESLIGRKVSVVTLGEERPQGTTALSDNYVRVWIEGERLPANRIVEVTASSVLGDALVGRTGSAAPVTR